ncbi:MAG: hypothetical protein Q8P30_01425 [Candidatus Uhrbacteria bacterium]|nr:hypothetical protein [Candidatus Uhrbacteria bacterium]
MELKQILGIRTSQVLSARQVREDPIQALIRIWDTSPHYEIDLGEHGLIDFVLCDPKYLQDFIPGEFYGVYLGYMNFVSTKTPERWIPYVALHEWAEYNIGREFKSHEDPLGLAKQWQALFGEIRMAGLAMSEDEFNMYIVWRESVETTRYFELDHEAQECLKRAGSELAKGSVKRLAWTRRDLRAYSLRRFMNYDQAYMMGMTHTESLISAILDCSHPVGDIYAVLSYFAYVDVDAKVSVPRSLAHIVYFLAAEIERPVLKIVQDEGSMYSVSHASGRTRQTVDAVMRRLGVAQVSRMRSLPNQIPKKEIQMSSAILITHRVYVSPRQAEILLEMRKGRSPADRFSDLGSALCATLRELGVVNKAEKGSKPFYVSDERAQRMQFIRQTNEDDIAYPVQTENEATTPTQWIDDLERIATSAESKGVDESLILCGDEDSDTLVVYLDAEEARLLLDIFSGTRSAKLSKVLSHWGWKLKELDVLRTEGRRTVIVEGNASKVLWRKRVERERFARAKDVARLQPNQWLLDLRSIAYPSVGEHDATAETQALPEVPAVADVPLQEEQCPIEAPELPGSSGTSAGSRIPAVARYLFSNCSRPGILYNPSENEIAEVLTPEMVDALTPVEIKIAERQAEHERIDQEISRLVAMKHQLDFEGRAALEKRHRFMDAIRAIVTSRRAMLAAMEEMRESFKEEL